MYFNNLVRLATHYLKNFIPQEKEILTEYIASTEEKNTPKHALQWLDIVSSTQNASSQNLQQPIKFAAKILAANLSIDAWYSGIEYEKIDNQQYIEFLLKIIATTQNIHVITQNSLNEEHYHILQTELFNFSKSLLLFLLQKKYIENYSIEQFKSWLAL